MLPNYIIDGLDLADPKYVDIDHIDTTTHIAFVRCADGSIEEFPAEPQNGPAAELTQAEQDHLFTTLVATAPSPGEHSHVQQLAAERRVAQLEAEIADLRARVSAQEEAAARNRDLAQQIRDGKAQRVVHPPK